MRNPSTDPSRRVTAALLIAVLCPLVASLVVAPDLADRSVRAATLAAQDETIWTGSTRTNRRNVACRPTSGSVPHVTWTT